MKQKPPYKLNKAQLLATLGHYLNSKPNAPK